MVDNIFIGLMTGTSSDSLDLAAIQYTKKDFKILGLQNFDIPDNLKGEILKNSQALKIDWSSIDFLDKELGKFFSISIQNFLKSMSLEKNQITAIGSHGQTIKHQPNAKKPFSLQIGNPQLISDDLGITVVGKFRDDDIDAGGQGAPISPVFHKEVFASLLEKRVIINIGGITNITLLDKDSVIGFDTGPGNCLIDAWNRNNWRGNYDVNGQWARSGNIDQNLLNSLMSDEYFLLDHPKSTGPDYFNLTWLEKYLGTDYPDLQVNDIQATLTELTALSLTNNLETLGIQKDNIFFCGGGIHNSYLIERISKRLNKECLTTQELDIDPDYLEAICFAWLAKKRIEDTKFDLQKITGSKKAVYLGKVFNPLR